jgi:hypothetical protein
MRFQRTQHAKRSTRVKGCWNFLVHPSTSTATFDLEGLSFLELLCFRSYDMATRHSLMPTTITTQLYSIGSTEEPTFHSSLNRLPSGSVNFSDSPSLHPFVSRFLITTG